MVRVLFVCMGNICRSPTAHAVFRQIAEEADLGGVVTVDSAGTHAYHVGEQPDERSQMTAVRRGIDMSDLRARRVVVDDFERFDYVLAMDQDNLQILESLCPPPQAHKLRLFMGFAPDWGAEEVPDPYYGGASGFERVFDMVEAAARGLLADIRQSHL